MLPNAYPPPPPRRRPALTESYLGTVTAPATNPRANSVTHNFENFSPYEIPGNCKPETKLVVQRSLHAFIHRGTGFADYIGSRVKLTEISVNGMAHEPERKETRVVAEITLEEGAYAMTATS